MSMYPPPPPHFAPSASAPTYNHHSSNRSRSRSYNHHSSPYYSPHRPHRPPFDSKHHHSYHPSPKGRIPAADKMGGRVQHVEYLSPSKRRHGETDSFERRPRRREDGDGDGWSRSSSQRKRRDLETDGSGSRTHHRHQHHHHHHHQKYYKSDAYYSSASRPHQLDSHQHYHSTSRSNIDERPYSRKREYDDYERPTSRLRHTAVSLDDASRKKQSTEEVEIGNRPGSSIRIVEAGEELGLRPPDSIRTRTGDVHMDEEEEEVEEEEEDAEDYKAGGYHPLQPTDTLSGHRYVIIRKLGWGHFSTVWLARDTKTSTHVALKIVKSAAHYTEAALDEIKLLERVNDVGHAEEVKDKLAGGSGRSVGRERVLRLLDSFKHTGPNGTHVVMSFEVLGPNLLTLIRKYKHRGIPIDMVKRIMRQCLEGLDFLHRSCGIIHTDLKPENILMCIPIKDVLDKRKPLPTTKPPPIDIKIADLGNACWSHHHFTSDIQTRQYRSPEVLLGAEYYPNTDLWSLGCLGFELLTGDYLFDAKGTQNFGKDDDHLAQIQELLGPIPSHLLQSGTLARDFFNIHTGTMLRIPKLKPWGLKEVLRDKYAFSEKEAGETAEFFEGMLRVDPWERKSAEEMLKHRWVANA
ncbi:serine/threonine protein kinase, CMGC group [Chytridiales sp. JEL 0842]|nr:serine/threonine protein kinase, CMGC group [Chytridiales sp. JEL 0842]